MADRLVSSSTRRRVPALAASAALLLAACGGDDDASTEAPTPADITAAATVDPSAGTTDAPVQTDPQPGTTDAPVQTDPQAETTDPTADEPFVALAETDLGTVIVDRDGFTLYAFDLDTDGAPNCTGECAQLWPPYGAVDGTELTAGDGLDASLLSLVEHPDGGEMVKYGNWPLYHFADDEGPGDTIGQGINDVWWVLDADGQPVRPEMDDEEASPTEEALVTLAATDLGDVIVAADGRTLYLFTPDADQDGSPTCAGTCAGTWPPYLVDAAELAAGDGLDASLLSVVEHPDGGQMLRYGDWPLYFFGGDEAAGDINGQGVNDVWWLVDAEAQPLTDNASGFSYDY